MRINYLGHAAFIIEVMGKRIITDPYSEKVGYKLYLEPVDFVTISHDHHDHNTTHYLNGIFQIIEGDSSLAIPDMKIYATSSWHDDIQGRGRGSNMIFKIEAEGINIAHMGDVGTVLNSEQIEALGKVDILLVPVGGFYTINAEQAWIIVGQLKPKIVIPMHFRTAANSDWPIKPVEDFTVKAEKVTKLPELQVDSDSLPEQLKVIVLECLAL